MSRHHSTMIEEQKYDAPSTNIHNRDKDDMKAQTHAVQSGVKSPREVELRRAFEQADFSERVGSPAERLEKMSKAVNELTHEREEVAKQMQIAEDSEHWNLDPAQGGGAGSPRKGPAKLDTRFKIEPTPKGQPAEPASSDSQPIASDSQPAAADIQPSASEPAAKPMDKMMKPVEKIVQSVRQTFTRTDDSVDEEHGHGQDYPSERVSKLDRPARVAQAAKEQVGQVSEGRPKDDEEEGPTDKLEELPFLERNKVAREAEQAANGFVQRAKINLGGARSLSHELKPAPEVKFHDREALLATKLARQQDHLKEEEFDPDNHVPESGISFKNELKIISSRLSMLGTKGGQLHAPVKTDDAQTRHWPRGGVSEVPAKEEGILSSAKHKLEDRLEHVEDKLSEWKHEAGDQLGSLKQRLTGDLDEAKSKARELKDDAMDKGRELRADMRDKAGELKGEWREKTGELKGELRQKRAELRDDARDAQSAIHRDLADLKLKGRDLRDDAKSELSALSDKASALKDKAAAEIKEDVALVKDKLRDAGAMVKEKTDKLTGKVERAADDIKETSRPAGVSGSQSWWDRMDAHAGWWPKDVDASSVRRSGGGVVLRPGISGASSPQFDVRADPTDEDYIPARGRAEVMQAQLEELRSLESGGWKHDSSFAGGIRSQLSGKWQQAKDKAKQVEHDYLEEADLASSSDMDNAPTSPRVLEHATTTSTTTRWRSGPHPNTFSPSLSDVLPDDDVREHVYAPRRSASPIVIEQQRTIIVSPNGGRDLADMLDAIVEPW